jgi:membrane protein required for beta-lactamase induction
LTVPIFAFGLVLALLGIGIAVIPAWWLPGGAGMLLEQSRTSIAVGGLALGLCCALVSVLIGLSGS